MKGGLRGRGRGRGGVIEPRSNIKKGEYYWGKDDDNSQGISTTLHVNCFVLNF